MNKRSFFFFIFLFLFLHSFFFNFNLAEWGDSYNILRAAESLKNFEYPVTEKRLPFFPLLIALGGTLFEPLLTAKILVFIFTLLSLILLYLLFQKLFPVVNDSYLVLALLIFNPLFLYWSIRAMTDVVFVFFVLLTFYLWYRNSSLSLKNYLLLGTILGLASMTRFEGFLVASAILIPLILQRRLKGGLLILFPFFIVVSPYLLRNYFTFGSPLFSFYSEEAGGYSPDLRLLLLFLSYLIFLAGGPLTPFFTLKGFLWTIKKDWRRLLPVFLFISLLLPLIAYWTAAVPRLFVPTIPVFILFFVLGFSKEESYANRFEVFLGNFIFLIVFILAGLFLKPHFLVGSLGGGIFVILLSSVAIIFLFLFFVGRVSLQKLKLVILLSLISSNIVGSLSVLYRGKYIFSTTALAAQFAASLPGPVGYSDETGTTSWHLRRNGLYWNGQPGFEEALIWMRENNIKYVVVTNEHYDEGTNFLVVYDEAERDKFKLIKRFEREEFIDHFNRVFEKVGLMRPKEYPKKVSEIYEVIKYRED